MILIIILLGTLVTIVATSPGQSCEFSLCNPDHFTKCVDKVCQCEDGMEPMAAAVAVATKKEDVFAVSECRVRVGQSCAKNPKCMENGFCNHSKICECKMGYLSTLDPIKGKACLKGHNMPCTPSGDNCHFQVLLTCQKSKCKCQREGFDAEWSTTTRNRCVGLAHGDMSCSSEEMCTPKAKCTEDRKCRCETDYSSNQFGRCQRTYNATCHDQDGVVETEKCNGMEALSCSDGRCRVDIRGKCDKHRESAFLERSATMDGARNVKMAVVMAEQQWRVEYPHNS